MNEDEIDRKALELIAGMRPFAPSAAPGQNLLPPDTRFDVPGEYSSTPVWRAGDGPDTTLFVHGWDDSHRVWRRFAMHFIQMGQPVLLLDLPGHGAASKAEHCAWPHAGKAVHEVCEAEGPITTIIAHSFGCEAAARAVELGADIDTLVFIAPPLRTPERSWSSRQREQGADEAAIARAREIFREQSGVDIDGQDFRGTLERFAGRILLIGSEADESCPLSGIRELADTLPQADLVESETLDHRELALDTSILASITEYLNV